MHVKNYINRYNKVDALRTIAIKEGNIYKKKQADYLCAIIAKKVGKLANFSLN